MTTHYNYWLLGRWLIESGKTREQVCAEAGVSYPYLRHLERNGGNPSAAILARLAETYGHDIGELYADADRASA